MSVAEAARRNSVRQERPEGNLLASAIDRCLAACGDAWGPGAAVRRDLLQLGRMRLVRIAAMIRGLDNVAEAACAGALLKFTERIGKSSRGEAGATSV